jgi:membrane fusion protein, heavy metal efflux system
VKRDGIIIVVAFCLLFLVLVLLIGCTQTSEGITDTTPAAVEGDKITPTANAPRSEAVVELAQSQLNAIKIEPVGTYLFPIEKEAVGSVSFDEDPAIVQAESTLIGAAAALNLANKGLTRVRSLGETNGISQKELEQDVSNQQTAEAALKTARDAVRALGKTDAEIDAMIGAGKISGAGTLLARSESNGLDAPATARWVVANVSESDSPLLRAGQTVQVKVAAFPDRVFNGKISRIYGTVDPNTHRVTIRCEVKDAKHELRPGMLADVVIRVQEPVEATAIPADGVVRESDGTMTVWVTTDRHRFVQKIVKTGLRAGSQVQILNGLQRGELAVTEGGVFLSNMLNAPPSD